MRCRDPFYISFDTNCFVNRISYHLEQYGKGAFVVADGVRKELFKEVAGRYSEYELRMLIHKDKRFEQFLNQPKVAERIKKIGRAEYDRFKRSVVLEEIPSGTGDNEIAEALSNFARTRNCDIWIMTFDKNMYEVAAGFGIKPILFEFPRIREKMSVKVRWENVADLIYTMAVIFGFINISGINIFGVWKGKSPDDWSKEKVMIEGRGRIIEAMGRDLNILRKLKKINNSRSS